MRILLAFLLAFASVGSFTATSASAQQFGYHPACPSLDQARALFNVDVTLVGAEVGGCAWTMNTGNYSYLPLNLPVGWIITTAEPDGLVYVQAGDGSVGRVQAKAMTARLMVAYPGLTPQRQVELTKAYAPYAGYSPDIVVCRCSQAPGPAPAPQLSVDGCPMFGAYATTSIGEGRCLYDGPVITANVPDGWWAYAGDPPKRTDSGQPLTANRATLYPN